MGWASEVGDGTGNIRINIEGMEQQPAGLWDCYNYNSNEFAEDFASLSNVGSHEKLA